jgi:4-amino-4-deoxy-L-arabinose transferase-like glycosyltransferase
LRHDFPPGCFALAARTMKNSSRFRWLWIAALLAGLALRVFFVLTVSPSTGDGPMYKALAQNWRNHGIYGLDLGGKISPVDIRMPGYPAYLAAVSMLFGRGQRAPMLAQAVVDIVTCLLIAALAALLVPPQCKNRVGLAALWLSALCPFIANYASAPLTEVLATFWTAVALIALTSACAGREMFDWRLGTRSLRINSWLAGGLAVGVGTLLRPETPILLIALAILLVWRWRRPADWPKLVRAGALAGLGLVLPLIPWGVRNALTLHEFQPLAPRYASLPGEFTPFGFQSWTGTWMVRYRDVYLTFWKPGEDPLTLSDLPESAFDSDDERARVQSLYDQYNENCCDITPQWDAQFAELARQRTSRHPIRTHLTVPMKRVVTLWLTPRIELLPYLGEIWPLWQSFLDDRVDFSVTALLGLIGVFYVSLAFAGAARTFIRRLLPSPPLWAAAYLVTFCLVRTAFFAHTETPEPRYVLECFPAVIALAATLWVPPAL